MTAISVRGLTVKLGRATVLRDVDLDVPGGQWVGLIGPNGAGKTTLLRALAGLVRHDGTVALHGTSTTELTRRDWARALAVVPQEPVTPAWLTVSEYVLLGRTPHLGPLARESAADRDAATRVLERLDLLDHRDRTLGTLSGGERQRVVVARALAQETGIVLLDEPTAALDIGHQQQALELLDTLRAESALTLVAAMHDLTLAAQYAERMVLLDEGHVVADGAPADVLTEESLARHYAARARIVRLDDRLAVVPTRLGV